MTQKLIEERQKWGFNVNVLETGYLNVGSDIQNIKLEHNIEFKGRRSFRYVGSIFMNSVKCNKEVSNRTEQALDSNKSTK
jgi:hypothetical protein